MKTRNIRSLDLNAISGYICDPPSLRHAFQPLTSVTSVSVGRDGDFGFTQELLCAMPDPSVDPLFPHLRSLVLKHPRDTASLRSDGWIDPDLFGTACQRMETIWAAVTAVCSERYSRGSPLKHIHAVLFSIEELEGDENALGVQEQCINRVREWVEEVTVVNPDD